MCLCHPHVETREQCVYAAKGERSAYQDFAFCTDCGEDVNGWDCKCECRYGGPEEEDDDDTDDDTDDAIEFLSNPFDEDEAVRHE